MLSRRMILAATFSIGWCTFRGNKVATKGIKGFDIKGLKEVYKDLDITEEEIIKAARKGIKILGQNIAGEAQKICPVDTGTLRRSIVVSNGSVTNSNDVYKQAKDGNEHPNVQDTKDPNTVVISANTPYALKQHEDPTLNHPRGGEAKYLERPFNEKVQDIENFIGTEVYKAVRRKYKS